jgi:hypothetical protein
MVRCRLHSTGLFDWMKWNALTCPAIILGLLILPGPAAALEIIAFDDGSNEHAVELIAPAFQDGINFSVPAYCWVREAVVNISTPPTDSSTSQNPSLWLDNTLLWSFNGTGFGGFGYQNLLSDGSSYRKSAINTTIGGKISSIRLPKRAVVQNATISVGATGPGNFDRFASFAGSQAGDYVGTVANAGDLNGDGFADIIVGAAGKDTGLADVGKAYIFFGGHGMDGVPDIELVGTEQFEGFGSSVAGAGDLNGDGYDDVIVGAPDNDAGADTGGRACIFYGGPVMDNTADVMITGTIKNQALGISVSGAGDLNGDGYDDIIVGGHGTSPGWANIYFGGAAMDNAADVCLVGNGGTFGDPVAGVEDVNGDGYDDVMIGEGSLNAGGSHIGRAYIYYGGTAMNTTPDVTFTGEPSLSGRGCQPGWLRRCYCRRPRQRCRRPVRRKGISLPRRELDGQHI